MPPDIMADILYGQASACCQRAPAVPVKLRGQLHGWEALCPPGASLHMPAEAWRCCALLRRRVGLLPICTCQWQSPAALPRPQAAIGDRVFPPMGDGLCECCTDPTSCGGTSCADGNCAFFAYNATTTAIHSTMTSWNMNGECLSGQK